MFDTFGYSFHYGFGFGSKCMAIFHESGFSVGTGAQFKAPLANQSLGPSWHGRWPKVFF